MVLINIHLPFIQETELFNNSKNSEKLRFMDSNSREINNCYYIQFEQLFNISQHESIVKAERLKKQYQCKYCGRIFNSGCALGGHISKVHRGLSKNFKIKRLLAQHSKANKERNRFLKNIRTKDEDLTGK